MQTLTVCSCSGLPSWHASLHFHHLFSSLVIYSLQRENYKLCDDASFQGPYNVSSAVDASKYLTLVGVIAALISSLMAHGFLTMSRRIQAGAQRVACIDEAPCRPLVRLLPHAGKTVAKNYLVNSLLTNNAISLAGIGITVIGLQASVGKFSVFCTSSRIPQKIKSVLH
eukprot:1160653-Pelagomonas_calceolata.AAC.22